ncbi:MAG: flagellar biosynthesis regulator FlaF [Candidatus Eisenbacteria bacterium]|uniref:Flagellar biosynthesis regulator FlaF n=1 Tax=Eiseniibacteriota bacterium TaxID=2212470 RepID=A0A7Y2EAG0_UNCEI|nr:flagellar biosynthesis regulator FlaF [Candidatus Eisenbacteria bacterium]
MLFPNAQKAYDQGKKATDSTRHLEAAALFKTARMIEACQQNWETPERVEQLKAALRHNQRLWTFFQTELARTDHELPVALRIDLLQLSAFIDKRTFEILANPSPEKLTALIDINRHVGSGLSQEAA